VIKKGNTLNALIKTTDSTAEKVMNLQAIAIAENYIITN